MSRKTSLMVNSVPIKLDYYVEGYVFHIARGIIDSLQDTGAIKELTLTIENTGKVKIVLNGVDVRLKPFPMEIISNTLAGMVANLKGVKDALETLEIKVANP